MERKGLVVLCAGLMVLVISVALIPPTGSLAGTNFGDRVRNHISVVLKVYKNHELIREKVGDPISDQWLALVSKYLLGLGAYTSISWITEDGSSFNGFGTEFENWESNNNPVPKLAIGTGSGARTSDYALSNKVMEQTLDSNSITVTDAGYKYNVTFAYTFIVDQPYNISEAGLFIRDRYGGTTKWVLVAHDSFAPVSLNTNDGIMIAYSFIIDYSNPPFLKTFWQLLIDYFLGLRGAGCPVGNVRIDLGQDYVQHGYINHIYDDIVEKLCFAYVTNNVVWTPIASPNSTDKWGIRKVISLVDSDQTIDAEVIAIQGNSLSSFSVYGLMFYLYTDTNPGDGKSGGYVPIAYIYFGDTPVSVSGVNYYVVHLEIKFNRG